MAVAIIAFSVGFALGGRDAANGGPGHSSPPAFVGASVSRELRTAYLNVIGGGWAVCSVAVTVTCQPELAIPNIEFTDFAELPLSVSANDWGVLTALTVPLGHYVLAGPMSVVGPQAAMAKIATNGAGTLVGLGDQAVLDGVTYVDLGTLAAGRFVGVVRGYELQAGGSERADQRHPDWVGRRAHCRAVAGASDDDRTTSTNVGRASDSRRCRGRRLRS